MIITMPCVIDTHCHMDAPELAHDVDVARALARTRGVAQLVIPAVDVHNFAAVQALAQRHGDAYALGIHPMCTPGAGATDLDTLAQWLERSLEDPHLVAVGEIGLDYFVEGLDAAHQEQLFAAQLQLAQRFGLPVLLHVRRSVDRVLKGVRNADEPWHCARLQWQPAAGRGVYRAGLQARLWWRHDA